MFNVYVVYLSLNNEEVTFSQTYSSHNTAKDNIDTFLKKFYEDRSKKIEFVNKEKLELLKKNVNKKSVDVYIKKRRSYATIYDVVISPGRVYDSYSLEKKGHLGISEICVGNPNIEKHIEVVQKTKELVPVSKVTNYEHGTHVHFISELKSLITKKYNERTKVKIPKTLFDNSKMENFISNLIAGKESLKHITLPSKLIIEERKTSFKNQKTLECLERSF